MLNVTVVNINLAIIINRDQHVGKQRVYLNEIKRDPFWGKNNTVKSLL